MKFLIILFFAVNLTLLASKKQRPGSQQRIIGGSSVNVKDAKYMGSLILLNNRNIHQRHTLLCGTVIIGMSWTLTAASCLDKVADKLIHFGNVRVRTNTTNWQDDSRYRKDRRIVDSRKHQLYRGIQNYYDYNLALIKVEDRFDEVYERAINLAPDTYHYRTFSTAYVYGWGLVDPDNPAFQPPLMGTDLKISNFQECQAYVRNYYGMQISWRQVCTEPSDEKDFCTGDEGGPLVQDNYAIGLMSWNPQCAIRGVPSVYTRLSLFNEWIFRTMRELRREG
ncbi:hypothetical protein ILUMI_26288 [Ignelater luminosus]|uniref:Peptidase S1 domain-containing protein n=1 Tax=Ignelater luminosus TaxID=2038154 RepID=A0A8K0C4G5_IGNLU|nr:hypothetical protein ILUMI_26288 [Ignelater luminosus]